MLWDRRIACLTYRKSPGDLWPESEFAIRKVRLASGDIVEMSLAERRVDLGSKKDEKINVREIRRKTHTGHQVSIVCTDYSSDLGAAAAAMFARWSQENFFKYMQENYNINQLVDYRMEELPDTLKLVNPEHRRLDGQIRSKATILSRKKAAFGAMSLSDETELAPPKMEMFLKDKTTLHEEIGELQQQVDELKQQRKNTKSHISVGELTEEERFRALHGGTKHLLDTIKMIAYRSETSMAHILQEKRADTRVKAPHKEDARALLRSIYTTESDLLPDYQKKLLQVRLHHAANNRNDESIRHLCKELNDTETVFPGTDLVLVYDLVS
jgi:hypothetical protein